MKNLFITREEELKRVHASLENKPLKIFILPDLCGEIKKIQIQFSELDRFRSDVSELDLVHRLLNLQESIQWLTRIIDLKIYSLPIGKSASLFYRNLGIGEGIEVDTRLKEQFKALKERFNVSCLPILERNKKAYMAKIMEHSGVQGKGLSPDPGSVVMDYLGFTPRKF